MHKKIIIWSLLFLLGFVVVLFGFFFAFKETPSQISIESFEECVAAGNPVAESYPRQCRANGELFVENIGNELEKIDLIRLDSPRPNASVSSPLTLQGEARGYWYFEASFPIEIRDANGLLLGQHYTEAQSEWMTEAFVPFKGTLNFQTPTTATGTLILRKDNASGLPEHDDELVVPIKFQNINDTSAQSLKPNAIQNFEECVAAGNLVMESYPRKCRAGDTTFTEFTGNTITFNVYFGNSKFDPQTSCTKVFPITRKVPYTPGVARAALTELFKGPTENERTEGYTSLFSSKTAGILKNIRILNNIAYIDLNDIRSIIPSASASCASASFFAETENTLKQFSTIKKIIFAINGDTKTFYEFMQLGCSSENNNCDNTPFTSTE